MTVHTDWIRSLHPALDTQDETLNGNIAYALKRFDTALYAVGDKFKEYKDDIRLAKTNEVLLKSHDELTAETEKIFSKPLAEVLIAETDLEKKSAPPKYEDSVKELLAYHKAKDDRQELAAMDTVERRNVIMKSAESGDRSLIDAVRTMRKPFAADAILNEAEQAFIKAKFPAEVKALETAKEKAAHMVKAKDAVPYAVNKIARGRGLDIEGALKARREEKNAALHARSTEEKAQAVKDKGVEGFISDYK